MSSTIWKYMVSLSTHTELLMPEGSEILHVDVQGGEICMWVWVNPDNRKEAREFKVVGTGHNMRSKQIIGHIGTVQVPPFVWHVFEIGT